MSNLKLNASDVFKWLLENNYLEGAGTPQGNQLTSQFFKDAGKNIDVSALPVPAKAVSLLPTKKEDWDTKFIHFIMAAQVPARIEDSQGNPYYANKFSEPALKVFRKALESGVDEQVLIKSTMLYYKSSVRYKKTIGNYFTGGDWRTDYEALVASASTSSEALNKHIKDEIKPNNGERSNYSIG